MLFLIFETIQTAKYWYIRFANKIGFRKDKLVCIRQKNTYFWGPDLGDKTPGECSQCKEPIFFEKQNNFFIKICYICWADRIFQEDIKNDKSK